MAIDLKTLKPNVPQVKIEDFFWLISGIPKCGKTTLFAKLVETYFGDITKGLLLGFEHGFSALRVNATDIDEWDDFEEIVDQLIDDKDELPFKLIGIDTADVMWEMAQQEVIREWNMKNPGKRTSDIGGVGAKGKSDSGYGVGYQKAKEKIRKNIDKLVKAGYGIMVLTHSKDKEIEQKDGLTYDQLVVSLPGSARDIFVNMADFIVFITIEKIKNEQGNLETKRYMYWRTDGYVEAGSRFKHVPERIEYNVDEFINVFKNAVEKEFENKEEVKKAEEQQKQEKEEKTKQYIEEQKNNLQDIIEKIKKEAMKAKKKVKVEQLKEIIGNNGDPTKLTDVTEAKNVLAKLEEISKQ